MDKAVWAAAVRLVEAASTAQKWRELDPLVRKERRRVGLAFRRQGRLFVRGFREFRPRFAEAVMSPTWSGVPLREAMVPEDEWAALWDDVARRTLALMLAPITALNEQALTLGAGNLIGSLGVDMAFSLRNPRATAYLQEHGAAMVTRINAETQSQLRTLITRATSEGWSYSRTARAINERFEDFAGLKPQQHIRDRAELVAVTEAGQAYEAAGEIVVRDLQEAGIRMEKRWLTVGDNRVSDGCRQNEDEGWIPLAQAFPSGHQRPLRHPGCRCTALYRQAER